MLHYALHMLYSFFVSDLLNQETFFLFRGTCSTSMVHASCLHSHFLFGQPCSYHHAHPPAGQLWHLLLILLPHAICTERNLSCSRQMAQARPEFLGQNPLHAGLESSDFPRLTMHHACQGTPACRTCLRVHRPFPTYLLGIPSPCSCRSAPPPPLDTLGSAQQRNDIPSCERP